MALISQLINVPFTKGLNVKDDPLLTAQPVELRNLVFRGGTLQKRYGFTQLGSTADTGGTLTAGEAIFPFKSELVRINGGYLYRYSQALSQWISQLNNVGANRLTTIANTRIQRNTRTQAQFDQTVSGNYVVYCWAEAGGPQIGIHIAIQDLATGTFLLTGETAIASSSGGVNPRCVSAGTKVFVFWMNGSNIAKAVVDLTSPEGGLSSTNIATNAASKFDAISYSTGAVVAYVTVGGSTNTLTYKKLDSSGAVTATVTSAALTLSSKPIGSLSIISQTDTSIYAVFSDDFTGSNSYFTVVDSSFASVLGATVVGPGVFTTVGLVESNTNTITAIYYGQTITTGSLSYAVLVKTGVGQANTVIPNSIGLALQSHPIIWEGYPTMAVAALPRGSASSSVQPTGFIVQLTDIGTGNNVLTAVAKALPGLNGFTSSTRLSKPILAATNSPAFLFAERGRLAYQGNQLTDSTPIDVTPVGFTRVTLTKVTAAQLPINILGDAAYVGGAWPRLYDGRVWTETGFSLCPEGLTVSFGAGGSLSAGSYQFKAIYSWTNAQGELVRSIASPPVTGTATSTQKATVVVPTLPLSMRDSLPAGVTVQVELYRTEVNGAAFYRSSSVTSPSYNSITATTVSIVDGLADTSLIVGELLYSTGGVSDWVAPPAYSIACVHRERLIIAGMEDPYEWRSSSTRIPGEALRFNELWGGRVPAATGKITALASLDGTLIIFTQGGAYAVQGDGPDLLGSNAWPSPQLITSVDAGAISAQSVASTPLGIFFQSPRGIKLLDRGLQVQYIGAPVEAFTSATGAVIRCVTVRPEVEQVWFHIDTGSDTAVGTANALVYDLHYSQWSVMGSSSDTYGLGAQSACYYQGLYTRVTSDGVIWVESPGTFKDNTHAYTSIVETEWVHVAGVQGYQRVYRAGVLGTQGSACTITMVCRSDYQGTVADETVTFNTASLASTSPLQFRHHLSHQKTESVRFRISDGTPGGTGAGMNLTNLVLEIGIKRGSKKLPAAASI